VLVVLFCCTYLAVVSLKERKIVVMQRGATIAEWAACLVLTLQCIGLQSIRSGSFFINRDFSTMFFKFNYLWSYMDVIDISLERKLNKIH